MLNGASFKVSIYFKACFIIKHALKKITKRTISLQQPTRKRTQFKYVNRTFQHYNMFSNLAKPCTIKITNHLKTSMHFILLTSTIKKYVTKRIKIQDVLNIHRSHWKTTPIQRNCHRPRTLYTTLLCAHVVCLLSFAQNLLILGAVRIILEIITSEIPLTPAYWKNKTRCHNGIKITDLAQ